MKKRLLLTFLSVLSIISTIRGQEIGANFNESISEPLEQVNLLKKSGVTWVRGFIDLPLHLLENEGEEGKQKIKTEDNRGKRRSDKELSANLGFLFGASKVKVAFR